MAKKKYKILHKLSGVLGIFVLLSFITLNGFLWKNNYKNKIIKKFSKNSNSSANNIKTYKNLTNNNFGFCEFEQQEDNDEFLFVGCNGFF